jgi:cell division septation protein DedD
MAELTHDEDGFHEIQLSGKQIVFLFMATTVVIVSIFLCGVMVGRGVRAAQTDDADIIAAAGPATIETQPAVDPPPVAPPTPDEPVGYDARLLDRKTPSDPPLKRDPEPEPAPVPQNPPPPPPVVEAEPEASVPTTGRPGPWVLQVMAVQNRASATQIVKRLIDKGHPAFLQTPAPREPVIYRVRLGGFKDRRDAESLAQRLQKEEQLTPVVTKR